jgi:hypothetical protein
VTPVAALRIAAALLLALVTSEMSLRVLEVPRKHDREGSCDNQTSVPDERAGWVWRDSYARDVRQGGRMIHFAFDRQHDRAPSERFVEDPDAPTVLFVGESIVAGHGLQWEETLPALVGDALNVQVVDLGVDGFGSDQAFVRFIDAMPRFHHVVAVVTLFFPELVERVSWPDRPRLSFDGHVPWVSPARVGFWEDMRLVRLERALAPLDADAVALTGRIFLETARVANEHGARALFLTPYFPDGWPRGDRRLVDELLVKPGLTVVDPDWGYEPLPGDNHPDAASTRRLAAALAAALRNELAGSRSFGPQ